MVYPTVNDLACATDDGLTLRDPGCFSAASPSSRIALHGKRAVFTSIEIFP